MRAVAIVVVGVAFIACRGGAPPSGSVERAPIVAPSTNIASDAAIATNDGAVAQIVDESDPAKLAFLAKPGRSLVGHTRASWPLDLPEAPWVANTFVNLSLDTFDGTHVTGSVDFYAAPGLDAKQCTPELVWDSRKNLGVQLTSAPAIERIDDHIGSRAIWRFRSPVPGAPAAATATLFVFCPNDVMFYSIEMIAPGPTMRDEYCKAIRRDKSTSLGVSAPTSQTIDVMFACGALIRQRGRDLVDECRGDTLLSLDALGPQVTSSALPAGTPLADEELHRWHARSHMCIEVHLAASPSFTTSAKKPFEDFAERAGDRLVSAFSRDGMIHR